VFDNSADWVLRISESRQALLDDKGNIKTPVSPIEPNHIFTNQTVCVVVTSNSAPLHWYRGGDIYQSFKVPLGDDGYAAGQEFKIVLRRYQILTFNLYTEQIGYYLSYLPPYYFKDVSLRVWEFQR
jgi:hypothetical protein